MSLLSRVRFQEDSDASWESLPPAGTGSCRQSGRWAEISEFTDGCLLCLSSAFDVSSVLVVWGFVLTAPNDCALFSPKAKSFLLGFEYLKTSSGFPWGQDTAILCVQALGFITV